MSDVTFDYEKLPLPALPVEATFDGFLGLEWHELEPTSTRATLSIRDNLRQPLGLVHGGVFSSIAETMASVATVREVWQDGQIGLGMSNNATFIRPVTQGIINVSGSLRGKTDREWVWSHEFTDEEGRLCALVDVTIAVRPAPAS